MYNILIVDDEILAIKAIQACIDWDYLEISGVFTAYSTSQAKEIFKKNTIDIILCDIELPQENGLELMSWVKSNYPQTESIILTCHTDFQYAKKAIQLGSVDYIIKPVPKSALTSAIKNAVTKIRNDRELLKLYEENQLVKIKKSWLDIERKIKQSDLEVIREFTEDRNLSSQSTRIYSILVVIQQWKDELKDSQLKGQIKEAASQAIFKAGVKDKIVDLEDDVFLIILAVDPVKAKAVNLEELCRTYISECNDRFGCDLSCYIGSRINTDTFLPNVKLLFYLGKNNVAITNNVLSLEKDSVPEGSFTISDMNLWSMLLIEGSGEKLISEVRDYFRNKSYSQKDMLYLLNSFREDFLQMVLSVLRQKGIQAHQISYDNISSTLYENAIYSVNDMIIWVEYIVTKSIESANIVEKTLTIVDKAIDFIKSHIDQDLKREDVANYVYLNPDYLTRIFKKEVGVSITEYIFNKRMDMAKRMLESTDMTICAIALKVGYTHFSHFAKMFRKHTGMNPADFRNNVKTG